MTDPWCWYINANRTGVFILMGSMEHHICIAARLGSVMGMLPSKNEPGHVSIKIHEDDYPFDSAHEKNVDFPMARPWRQFMIFEAPK